MNKIISITFVFVGLVVGILALGSSALAVQGDPIPGVDVSVEQSPSGIKVSTTTDSNGIFIFDHMGEGQYIVRVTPPKVKAGVTQNYNSSKSNTAGIKASNGSTTMKITVDLFTAEKATPFQPIRVTFGPNGGVISGTVAIGTASESKSRFSFLRGLGQGISQAFTSVFKNVWNPTQRVATPSASPEHSATPTPTPTPTRSVSSTPMTSSRPEMKEPNKESVQETARPTAPTSGGSTSSTNSNSTPTPTSTPVPTATTIQNTDAKLISVYPRSVSMGQEFTINGSNFMVGRNTKQIATVKLNATSIAFAMVDGQTIFATASLAPGVYDVTVITTAGQTLTLQAALTIQ